MNALTLSNARRCVVGATLVAAALVAPAGAQQGATPAPGCYGAAFKDKTGDHASQAPAPGPGERNNLDLTEGFFTAGTAPSVNIRVADLTMEIPTGATAISWYVRFGGPDGEGWIRAMTDFTGVVFYDYGHFQTIGVSDFSVRDGATTGATFEGPNGIVQVALPTDSLGKPGSTMKAMTFFGYEARQVLPAASPTPIKGGFLYEVDSATAPKYQFTAGAPCPETAPAPPGLAPSAPQTSPPPLSAGGPLPVKLATKSVKAKKAKKGFAVKLSSSEKITNLGARLLKGKKAVAKGSLASLDGKGTLKLKGKGIKKGSYKLELAGTDASGSRRFALFGFKVK